MKVGVISDTHVSRRSLHPGQLASRYINKVADTAEELVEKVKPFFAGVDLIIHAGDYVSSAVITALEEFAPVEGVAGNMDPAEITSRLPTKKTITAAGFKIGIIHGFGAPHGLEAKLRREFSGVDLIVFGHTHHPFEGKVDGVFMFNPGSPTDQRWAPVRAVGLLQLEREIRTEVIKLP